MRVKAAILAILGCLILFPAPAGAIDQETIDNMVFLLMQYEWNRWDEGVFDDVTLYDGLTAIYAQAVNSNDSDMVRRVVWAMGETGLAAFAPTVIAAMSSEPISACFALGKLPSEDAVDALIAKLEDSDPQVRDAAAWGLGNIPYDSSMAQAREKALSALGDRLEVEPESWIRETITGAIVLIETGVAAIPAFETPVTE